MDATGELYVAISDFDVSTVEKAIKSGADVNKDDLIGDGDTFMELIFFRLERLYTTLVCTDDPKKRDEVQGDINKQYRMIELLIDGGFDVNRLITSTGTLAFDNGTSYLAMWIKKTMHDPMDFDNQLRLVTKLLEAGANPNAPCGEPDSHTGFSGSYLHHMISNMQKYDGSTCPAFLPILKMLIENGIDFSVLREHEISELKESPDYLTIKDIMISSGYQPL